MEEYIKYNEATGKVEMDLEVYKVLARGKSSLVIPSLFKAHLSDTYGKGFFVKAEKETGIDLGTIRAIGNDTRNGVIGTKLLHVLELAFPDNKFIIDVPTFSPGKDSQINIKLVKDLVDKLPHGIGSVRSMCDTDQSIALWNLLRFPDLEPRPRNLAKIAATLNVPVNDLILVDLPKVAPPDLASFKKKQKKDGRSLFFKLFVSLKITQTEFAKQLGVSINPLNKWIDGSYKPDLKRYIKICQYFNVPFDYFNDWLI